MFFMSIISISLNNTILQEIDKIQQNHGYSSRSEVIRAGVRVLISENRDTEKLSGNINDRLNFSIWFYYTRHLCKINNKVLKKPVNRFIASCSKKGTLEWWNSGIMEEWVKEDFQHSIIPVRLQLLITYLLKIIAWLRVYFGKNDYAAFCSFSWKRSLIERQSRFGYPHGFQNIILHGWCDDPTRWWWIFCQRSSLKEYSGQRREVLFESVWAPWKIAIFVLKIASISSQTMIINSAVAAFSSTNRNPHATNQILFP